MFYLYKFVKKGLKDRRKIISALKNTWMNRSVDTFIVSFPKTGRTWLRVLIGKALCESFHLDEKWLLNTYQLTKMADIKRVAFTHDGPFNLPDFSPYYKLKFNKNQYLNRTVIFLVRDIRDTIVSFYFQHNKRTYIYKGDLHLFIRDDRLGIRRIISFYNLWYRNRHIPQDFLLIRYEEMHQNAAQILRKVLNFIDVKEINPEIIDKAIFFSSFNNMKQLEMNNYFHDSIMHPGIKGDEESFKIRRGKIGGYIDYLNAEDLAYINQSVKEMGIRDCNWYFTF